MSFEHLGLTPELLRAVSAQGYTEPTPVQAESIPTCSPAATCSRAPRRAPARRPPSCCRSCSSSTPAAPNRASCRRATARGRGATGLPIRCLVLTPTRELALQIEESVRTYGCERPVRSTAIYGGVGFDPQVRALRAGPEIVVATPGRLLDHAGQGTIDLRSVEILVLDEADRMLDMGFIRDIRRILALIPARRQNLLFSATFSDEIRELAATFLSDPAYVQIARRNAPIELVRQVVYPVDRERKRELLSHLIRSGRIDQALVFTRTKHGANRLAEQLDDGRHRGRRHPRQQEPEPARPGARRLQVGARRHPRRDRSRGPRPGHRGPAARRQLRAADGGRPTTCTASAAPAAPEWRATPSRWCASTSWACCARSRRCCAGRSRGRQWPASTSTARSGRRRSASARRAAGGRWPDGRTWLLVPALSLDPALRHGPRRMRRRMGRLVPRRIPRRMGLGLPTHDRTTLRAPRSGRRSGRRNHGPATSLRRSRSGVATPAVPARASATPSYRCRASAWPAPGALRSYAPGLGTLTRATPKATNAAWDMPAPWRA